MRDKSTFESTESAVPATVAAPNIVDLETDLVRIFDTTLRDGEQSPGASLTADEKLIVARMLNRLGVDVIEAGFPAASPDDQAAVREIAEQVGGAGGPIVAGLARACAPDIDAAWAAVRGAARPRIHTFLATSDLHIEHKLRTTREEVLRRVAEQVGYARSLCFDIEFSPEDASRSDVGFLVEVLAVALDAGATTLNIPDTVGYATPDEWHDLIATLIVRTPSADRAIWSVHCHDDLGLATANTLAGLRAGARQAEVTINGIGERAGNTSLEEVVMALATRPTQYPLRTAIETAQLVPASQLVRQVSGIPVQPNKAIVGRNAFAHEAGIHQDGMLKHERTYEIMAPESVGHRSRLVLGKHSGRHAVRARLQVLGLAHDGVDDALFARFKRLAERKKEITDADLSALVADGAARDNSLALEDLQVVTGRPGLPTATVRLRDANGSATVASAVGTGPVDAIFRAIDACTDIPVRLLDYRVESASRGHDAQGAANVTVSAITGGPAFHGFGADIDVLVASAKAYLAARARLDAAPPIQVGSDESATTANVAGTYQVSQP